MAHTRTKERRISRKEKLIEGQPMMRRRVAGGELGSKSHWCVLRLKTAGSGKSRNLDVRPQSC